MFSGEHCTSAFKGKGKVGPLRKLEKNPKYHSAFRKLDDDSNVSPQLLKELEQFTCLIYGQSRESSVDVVRHKLLRKIVGEDKKLKVDLACLPPCNSALRPHIHRVNHRVCLYKRADDPIIQKPQPCDEGQGWVMTPAGVLESYGSVLPDSLVDLLVTPDEDNAEEYAEEQDKDNEFDTEDFIESESDDES